MKKLTRKTSKITTLETILMSVKNKHLLIEIKKSKDECFDLEKFYNVIKKYDYSNISIQSFNKDVINWLKDKDKNLNLGILIDSANKEKKLKMKEDFVSIEHSKLTKNILEEQLKLKKDIKIWTVNNYSDIKKLKNNLGDLFDKLSIITDNPEIIKKNI